MFTWLKNLFSPQAKEVYDEQDWEDYSLTQKEEEELEERRRVMDNRMHEPFFDKYESDEDVPF